MSEEAEDRAPREADAGAEPTDTDAGTGVDGGTSGDRPGASKWWLLGFFTPVAIIVDQITKQIAEVELSSRGAISVVEGIFMLRYSRNRGAFFSLGEDLPDGLRRGFFVVATLFAMALIVHLYRRAVGRVLAWALLLLLAGALGNLVDRVLYGEVIDFLHLHYKDVFHWATFNVADIYICVGLVLLVVDLIRPGERLPEPGPMDLTHGNEAEPEET